jgi:hypothetical protein
MSNEYSKRIAEANAKQGFWDDRGKIPFKMQESGFFSEEEIKAVNKAFRAQALMLIVSEISEAMEADRKDLMDDKLTNRPGIEVELADAKIRIHDFCGGYGLDLDGAEEEKLAYNTTRPFKHGKSY